METLVEIDPTLTVAEADALQDRLADILLNQPSVDDVIVSLDADDGETHWTHVSKRPDSLSATPTE